MTNTANYRLTFLDLDTRTPVTREVVILTTDRGYHSARIEGVDEARGFGREAERAVHNLAATLRATEIVAPGQPSREELITALKVVVRVDVTPGGTDYPSSLATARERLGIAGFAAREALGLPVDGEGDTDAVWSGFGATEAAYVALSRAALDALAETDAKSKARNGER